MALVPLTVDPQGAAVTVDIHRNTDDARPGGCFTTQRGNVALPLPADISARTTFWVPNIEREWDVVATIDGQTVARHERARDGDVLEVTLEPGEVTQLDDDLAGVIEGLAGTYEALRTFNVMAYGAVGDGVADDTQAILDAYEAADAVNSGIVYLPRGTYLISDTITCDSTRVSIIGETMAGVVINYDGAGVAFDVTSNGFMRLARFTLNNVGTGTHGVVVGPSAAVTGVWHELDHITVNDFTTAGFHFTNCELGRFESLVADGCAIGFLVDNARHSGGSLGGFNRWLACRAYESSGRGWQIGSQAACEFILCESLRSGGAEQFYVAGTSRNLRIVNLDVETNSLGTTIGLSLGGSEHVVSISGFSLATGIALRSNASKTKVEVCKFSSVTEPLEIDAAATDIIVEDVGNLSGSTLGAHVQTTYVGGRGRREPFPFLTGRWAMAGRGTSNTLRGTSQGTMYLVPLRIRQDKPLDLIGVEITTAGTGSTVYRMGIYLPDESGMPATLLEDAGTVTGLALGNVTVASAATPTSDLVYVAVVAQTVTGTPALRAFADMDEVILATAFPTSGAAQACYFQSAVTGALPATLTPSSLGTTTNAPLIGVRYD